MPRFAYLLWSAKRTGVRVACPRSGLVSRRLCAWLGERITIRPAACPLRGQATSRTMQTFVREADKTKQKKPTKKAYQIAKRSSPPRFNLRASVSVIKPLDVEITITPKPPKT